MANIAPTQLRDLLKARGWQLIPQALNARLYALSHATYPSRQLVFPMDDTAPDYEESVLLVLKKLSELTKIDTATLAFQAKTVADDLIKLRVHNNFNLASLPLSFAKQLINNTEKLLKAAACTVVRPRYHHPRLFVGEATQLINKARFGQTEKGSFVLNIALPVNALETQGNLGFDDDLPFVRQVTASLNKGLHQLVSAIETDELDSLIKRVQTEATPVISSNLCDALAEMYDEQLENSLDINFNWSPLLKNPPINAVNSIRIQRDYFSRFEEVRRALRKVEADQQDVFIGTVERLDGELNPDGRRSGAVVLALLLPEEGETIRARVDLSPDQYAIADKAHMTNGAYIQVAGNLRLGQQPRQLVKITQFNLVNETTSN